MAGGSPDVPPRADAQKTILVAATGWGPSSGGVNAFSLDFSLALGRVLKGAARVLCLTTPVDDLVRAEAAQQGVEILTLQSTGPHDPTEVAKAARELLRRAGIERLDLTIGHDVFTGPLALALRSLMGTMAVVIHHMSYGSYQAVKSDGRTTRAKEEDQRVVLRQADHVCAVGPLLKRSAESLCQKRVTMIVPGLADITPVDFREGYFRAIAFGRLSGQDDKIKQGSLAAAAYGRFVRLASELDLRLDHRFNVFGLAEPTYAEEEKSLRKIVNTEARRMVHVVACPYTENRQELFEALSQNEVAMMLSWHEGFGLVGWEAIAACVPLVVSRASGLFELLCDDVTTLGADCVHAVEIRGSAEDTPNEEDVEAVARTLLGIATKLPTALGQANELREHLKTIYTWERCARALLDACGLGALLPPASIAEITRQAVVRISGSPGSRSDIDTLRAYTRETLRQQARFASIEAHGTSVKVRRACVSALVNAAKEGSVLIVGEPGAGKSGVQHDAVTELLATGADVVVFAAEALAAQSLGQLRMELNLEEDIVDVLDNWAGDTPAFLVIDALDAARSEGVAHALRDLIRSVINRNGRWRVIASIRKFDLRYSADLRRLVPGTAVQGFADAEFAQVRHLNVPVLDDTELGQVAAQSDELKGILDAAGVDLFDLLRVPFNLNLVAALLNGGIPLAELTPIRTQIELLDRHWDERVVRSDPGGEVRETVLRIVTEEMVRRRALRVPRSVVTGDLAASERLRQVLSAQVLIEWQAPDIPRPNQALLAFSHHLLFDYAVARLLFRGEAKDLLQRLENEPDLALFARPSIVLHFHHVWVTDPARTSFWDLVEAFQQSDNLSEIAKTIGPTVAADLFTTPEDFSGVVERLGGEQ
jgi:glycosyltransferase involved in cell wall biosynthesis